MIPLSIRKEMIDREEGAMSVCNHCELLGLARSILSSPHPPSLIQIYLYLNRKQSSQTKPSQFSDHDNFIALASIPMLKIINPFRKKQIDEHDSGKNISFS